MTTVINFDTLPAGTVITNQFASRGVVFTDEQPWQPTIRYEASAPSPANVLTCSFQGSVEFPDAYLSLRFTDPRHSTVSFSVGLPYTATHDIGFRARIWDAAGTQVGFTNYVVLPAGRQWTTGTVYAAGNIARLDVRRTVEGRGEYFYLDNLTFDDLGAPQIPAFRLEPVNDVYMNPLEVLSVPVRVTRLFGSTGPINFDVTNVPYGLEVVRIDPQPSNARPDEVVRISLRALERRPSMWLIDRWALVVTGRPGSAATGTSSQSVTVYTTVREPYDLRIVGMEVTQGIQTYELPTLRDPNVIEPVQYRGVRLVEKGRTLARVFVAYKSLPRIPPTQSHGFEVLLHGKTLNNITLPGSPVRNYGFVRFSTTMTSDVVTDMMRESMATDIEVPTSWAAGLVSLRAELRPSLALGPQKTFDVNAGNNVFEVQNIYFTKTLPLTIQSFQLRIQDPPNYQRYILPPPPTVFAEARNLLPLGANQLSTPPYGNVIDITDIFRRDDWDYKKRTGKISSRLRNAVDDWNFDSNDYYFLVGVYSSEANDVEYRIGGRKSDALGVPKVAMVEAPKRGLTSAAHEVGHLCGRKHASPANNARDGGAVEDWPPDNIGLIQGVGVDRRTGGATVRFCARSTADTTHPRYYDFMSYSGSVGGTDPEHWISTRGWDATIKWFGTGGHALAAGDSSGISSSDGPAATATTAARAIRRRSVTVVHAIIDASGHAEFTKIGPLENATELGGVSEESKYEFLLTDARGVELGRGLAVSVIEETGDEPASGGDGTTSLRDTSPDQEVLLMARIPMMAEGTDFTSVHRVELFDTETRQPILKKDRPAKGPIVSSPKLSWYRRGGLRVIQVIYSARHELGLPLEVKIDYLLPPSDHEEEGQEGDDDAAGAGKQQWKLVYLGAAEPSDDSSDITTEIPESFFPYNPEGQLRLRVSDGFNESVALGEVFGHKGVAPSVFMRSPEAGRRYQDGETIALHGEAYDDRQRPVDPARMVWEVAGAEVGRGSVLEYKIPIPPQRVESRKLVVELRVVERRLVAE